MQTETFKVPNIKCGGCVKAIEDGLSALPEVTKVSASTERKEVVVRGETLDRRHLADKLAELGYPAETGAE